MALGYLFQAIGLRDTSAGSSAFLTSAGSLMAGPIAWIVLRQRPSSLLAAGLTLALAGSALLGIRDARGFGAGEAWTLLGALAFALQIVVLGRWAERAEPVRLAAVQTAVAAALLLAAAPGGLAPLIGLDAHGRGGFAYLVVAGSVAAPLLQVLAQREIAPGRIGLLFALEPVFALACALTLGGERFVARWWWGASLILVAVLVVESRAWGRAAGEVEGDPTAQGRAAFRAGAQLSSSQRRRRGSADRS
jgi:drug/metabolite transporter (DMT)-like permease